MLCSVIVWEALRFQFLLESDRLSDAEKESYKQLIHVDTSGQQGFIMSDEVTVNSLRTLCSLLYKHYGQKLILLIDGKTVEKKINQELTYRDLYQSTENLWSVLFTTGYLTRRKTVDTNDTGDAADYDANDIYPLAIPNREIRKIFIDQVMEWFKEETRKDAPKLDAFCESFARGDAASAEQYFNAYLRKTISIRDTSVRKSRKENFYHGILLGLLSHREDWIITSNAESGDGFSDILIELEEEGIGIIIEVKYPDGENDLENGCKKALSQIEKMNYEEKLRNDGYHAIYKYGIACHKKRCMVRMDACAFPSPLI